MSDHALMEPSASPLADLILTRLLLAKKSVSPKQLLDDVAPLFSRSPSKEKVEEVLTALRAAGLVSPPKKQELTDAGRARALAYLGVVELPAKSNWGTVKAKFLVPKALGLSPMSKTDAKVLGSADKLAAFLLKRKLHLPDGTPTTLGGVFEAIACQALGFHDHTTLKSLIPHLLGKAINSDEPIGGKNAEKVVPRVLLGTRKNGMEGFRAIALERLGDWETGRLGDSNTDRPSLSPSLPVSQSPSLSFDLVTFAKTVKAEARNCPTGRFGDNKVFINHIWRQLRDEPRFATLGLAGFKEKLLEANRENLLTLSRADLVQVMEPADVRESETAYLNAVYHFILLEKE